MKMTPFSNRINNAEQYSDAYDEDETIFNLINNIEQYSSTYNEVNITISKHDNFFKSIETK